MPLSPLSVLFPFTVTSPLHWNSPSPLLHWVEEEAKAAGSAERAKRSLCQTSALHIQNGGEWEARCTESGVKESLSSVKSEKEENLR